MNIRSFLFSIAKVLDVVFTLGNAIFPLIVLAVLILILKELKKLNTQKTTYKENWKEWKS